MLIDAHTHLDKYEDELADALDLLEERRILTVSVAVDPESFAAADPSQLAPIWRWRASVSTRGRHRRGWGAWIR